MNAAQMCIRDRLYRYHTENGVLGDADRLALAETLDASIERMASAYALYDLSLIHI